MKQGYVYIGYDGSSKYFKIGKTVDLDRRVREIKNMNPTFEILLHAPVDDQNMVEAHLHKYFENRRVVGEWFNLSVEEVSQLTGGRITAEMINAAIEERKEGIS